jgi:hypothetical protein
MGEWLIGDVSFAGVHLQMWMLIVTAFFAVGCSTFGYSGNSVECALEGVLAPLHAVE